MLILNVAVYKLLCYNKINVYTKDLMLFCQKRCSTDLPSLTCIMTPCQTLSPFVFFIRTLQDDLRAVQIELKGFESCLNVSVTEWAQLAAVDSYP